MIVLYIIYILFLLWAVHTIRRIFYCIYFWQLKDYRIDRVKGDIKRSFNVFFPKTSILTLIILLLFPFFEASGNTYLWNSLVLIVFYLFGIYSSFLFYEKKWKIPKFTMKAMLLIFLSTVILFLSLNVFIKNFFIFIVITEIILTAMTFLITEALQVPTFFIKKIIYNKAENKINQLKSAKVIGITGSYGKSSTKEFLYNILSKKYKVLKTSGNNNTEIGIAQTVINKLKPEHEIFIVEMGAYRKGEIELICNIVKPKIGIITGINEQHLALFGSLKNLLSAEGGGELEQALPDDGILVVNGDNKYCISLYKKSNKNKKVYSLNNKIINSDIWSDSITVHRDYISFLAVDKSGEMAHFDVKVLGKHNVQNLLGAILIAKQLGMSFHEISEACKMILPENAGMVLKQGRHGIDVIDSSYSANPDGVFADLDYLSTFENKKVVVMPCLIELGEKSSLIHEEIGRKIAQICDLAIITSKDKFKEIEKGFNEEREKNPPSHKASAGRSILLCENSEEIYSAVTLFCKSEDAVLLEGRVPKQLINLLSE